MGTYLNPGNSGFAEKVKIDYVDKTGLICISRPRRFGKSYAAQMLCAYYDRSCDSHPLFDDLIIAKDENYNEYINHFNVISLDITSFISDIKKSPETSFKEIPDMIGRSIIKEITGLYPDIKNTDSVNDCLLEFVSITGTKIVFVIDEWDSVIREAKNDFKAQEKYLNLLRGWFKSNNFTPKVVAAAYITGILPIKKDGSQSTISDFQEYYMLDPSNFAEYVGFSEEEVRELCGKNGIDFSGMKKWYDGYMVGDIKAVYNPYSVMQTVNKKKFKSYWKKTSASETLLTYIDMDEDGLQKDIARLISGESIEVDTDSFQNEVETFTGKDDVLTLLIHLGYLTYEEVSDSYEDTDCLLTGFVHIPNEEVRSEFEKILRKAKNKNLIELVQKSDKLLKDTIEGREEAVARAIQEVHDSSYAPTYYNNEQSLRYVIKMAYISCVDQYDRIEELPSGHGMADVVFIPKKNSGLPAMIVELKWNNNAESTLLQINDKKYPEIFKGYGGDIVLAGISYDDKNKVHECKITIRKDN